MRYKQEFQICCGLVPGTKNDKDGKIPFDSFLQPLIEDFKVLATEGIEAFQYEEESASLQPFTLRGHLLTATGNMPAVSKLMCSEGTNSIYPCRYCGMSAVNNPDLVRSPYYMTTLKQTSQENPDYANLPLRMNKGIKLEANEIEHVVNNSKKEALQKASGINSECLLFVVDSLNLPWSFPLDTTHVLFKTIMRQLLSLWRGKYKNEKYEKGKE